MKKVRLKDIAKLANVSEATVSLVLNDKPSRISEIKKEEIRDIAKQLDYRPNYVARSLSTRKTQTIGLIIPDIENPYFSTLSKHIEDIFRSKGYLVFIVNSNDSFETDETLINELKDRQVDGLMICPSLGLQNDAIDVSEWLKSIEIPFVLIDRVFEEIETNQVSFDNEHGGYIATKYLIENGCKKIACFTGSMHSYSSRMRYDGYLRALKEASLESNDSLRYEGDYRYESGFELGNKLMERTDVDGVFSCNDLMAYGLLKAMHDHQKTQKDIRVVGYDNLKQSEMFGISLISVSQNIEALAEASCHQLFERIHDPLYRESTVLIPELRK